MKRELFAIVSHGQGDLNNGFNAGIGLFAIPEAAKVGLIQACKRPYLITRHRSLVQEIRKDMGKVM
jgi:hypothetical protein